MVNVYINPANKNKTTSLVASVSISGQRYKYPVGISVILKNWNLKKQRASEVKDYLVQATIINARIAVIKKALETVAVTFLSQAQKPTSDEFTHAVKKAITPVVSPGQSFVQFIELYYPTLTRSSETVKRYVTTINKLKEYETLNNIRLTFADIDDDFYNNLSAFFSQNSKSLNYFGGIIRVIKFFFHAAHQKKLHALALPSTFVSKNITSDSIFLSVDELQRIHDLVIDENIILEKIETKFIYLEGSIESMIKSLIDCRDRFLIGAFTALRFSDYNTLSNISFSDSFIIKTSHKTGVRTIIPMHSIIKDILIRRNNILPPKISNQRLNKQLKVLGKLAGINDLISVSVQLVSGLKTITSPKYELITTHTARRSGCTNMYLAGIDIISIMSFSGHKTTSSFLKYIKASQTEVATRLQNHPFFNPVTKELN